MGYARKPIVRGGSGLDIQIEGLPEFQAALGTVTKDMPEAMRKANYRAANKIVKEGRYIAQGLGRVSPLAAGSMRASQTASYASIRAGGARWPYFYGAEFGAKRRTKTNNKIIGGFRPWLGNQWTGWDSSRGYFLHAAIRSEGRQVIEDYWLEVSKLTGIAFPS